MKRSMLWLLGMTLALTACASETHLPYRAWRLSFSDVPHMPVWMEDASVVDVTGQHFYGYTAGALGDGNDGDIDPAGWSTSSGEGKGRDVIGAALPKQIYVRWQSLAEPQTYQATVDIPEAVRKLMLTQGPPKPRFTHAVPSDYYYNRINLGLAPGGWIKVWLGGILANPKAVMCVKATVVPEGPDLGKYGGRYTTLSAQDKVYLARHPVIPYASWDCNKH